MTQTKQIVEAIGLVKTYGETNVVDGVSFSVGEGEIFGILGPNDAGQRLHADRCQDL